METTLMSATFFKITDKRDISVWNVTRVHPISARKLFSRIVFYDPKRQMLDKPNFKIIKLFESKVHFAIVF